MKSNIKKKLLLLMTVSMTICFSCCNAGALQKYTADIPGLGLIMDEVEFDGITLKHLKFNESDNQDGVTIGNKFVITKPGYEHTLSVDYEIDADILDCWDFHHFIFGLNNDAPQGCLVHSFGLIDYEGSTTFRLIAPEKAGVYQLRFCHATGYGTFEDVKDQWWGDNSATSETIMGLVIVEDL